MIEKKAQEGIEVRVLQPTNSGIQEIGQISAASLHAKTREAVTPSIVQMDVVRIGSKEGITFSVLYTQNNLLMESKTDKMDL